MDKLKEVLKQYSQWNDYSIYIERIEGHIDSDFSVVVENSKALLESIGKEICRRKGLKLSENPNVNSVIKNAFLCLGYSNDSLVNSISGSLANIGQQIGNLRNDISITSHGKTLDELRDRNSKIDHLTKEFIVDSISIVSSLMIRSFEERKEFVLARGEDGIETGSKSYDQFGDFNDYWDDVYGEFQMGEYSFLASEILFNLDFSAYQTEYSAFIAEEKEKA